VRDGTAEGAFPLGSLDVDVDPLVIAGQIRELVDDDATVACDVGSQYRTGIFYHDDEQRRLAEASKAALEKSKPFKAPIVTEITRAGEFYPAEEYHQDYYLKNPVRYKFYRTGCGRDARLEELWGKQAHK